VVTDRLWTICPNMNKNLKNYLFSYRILRIFPFRVINCITANSSHGRDWAHYCYNLWQRIWISNWIKSSKKRNLRRTSINQMESFERQVLTWSQLYWHWFTSFTERNQWNWGFNTADSIRWGNSCVLEKLIGFEWK
jgi:hypothetical protein